MRLGTVVEVATSSPPSRSHLWSLWQRPQKNVGVATTTTYATAGLGRDGDDGRDGGLDGAAGRLHGDAEDVAREHPGDEHRPGAAATRGAEQALRPDLVAIRADQPELVDLAGPRRRQAVGRHHDLVHRRRFHHGHRATDRGGLRHERRVRGGPHGVDRGELGLRRGELAPGLAELLLRLVELVLGVDQHDAQRDRGGYADRGSGSGQRYRAPSSVAGSWLVRATSPMTAARSAGGGSRDTAMPSRVAVSRNPCTSLVQPWHPARWRSNRATSAAVSRAPRAYTAVRACCLRRSSAMLSSPPDSRASG